jgi:hypothetical protein
LCGARTRRYGPVEARGFAEQVMMHEGKGLGATFDRGYAQAHASAPQPYERTTEEKAAVAKTIADNFDQQLALVRDGVAAMKATAAARDLDGWIAASKSADQALQQLAHIAQRAPAAARDATDLEVRKRLASADQALADAQELVAQAPAAPKAAAPEVSCGDVLLAALPPDPPPSAWRDADFRAAADAAAAVCTRQMTTSDIAAFRAIVTRHDDHVIARRFRRFGAARRGWLLELLDKDDVKRSAWAREAARRADAADRTAQGRALAAATPAAVENTRTPVPSEGRAPLQASANGDPAEPRAPDHVEPGEALGSAIAARVPGVTYEGTGRFLVATGERHVEATIRRVDTGAAHVRRDEDDTAVLEIPTGLDENELAVAVAAQLRALQHQPSAHRSSSPSASGALHEVRAGTGGPLPYRSEMERSFGRSFGNVEAHTDMAAELAPLGAQALTIGCTIAFAESQPSPAVVTHEATHVAQNEQAGAAVAMTSGVVAPRDSAAEIEADTNASMVVAHGPGARLPPITAAPMASVHLAPKLLVPDADPPRKATIQVPDADHPSRRDIDGQQVIQTDKAIDLGKATPLRGKSWSSLAEVAESVHVQDDSGDTLHLDITYRLERRPAEVGEVPDIWIHTERKALLTVGSGEHAGATIVGQARIRVAPEEARDPKAAIEKASIGADHWAQIYLAEAQQYVNLHGPGGRSSLLADAAGNDVLAYDDPLRTLVGLKNILKQQHVAGHGGDVAKQHVRAQRLLADAKRGRAVLEREIAAIASSHDPHPGRVAPVRFLVGDIVEWLAANQQAGRDETEDANQLRKARVELEHLIADVAHAHAPKRDQLDDALSVPVRFVERTAEGVVEAGKLAVDGVVLGVDGLGMATGIGSFEYHPRSKYLQAAEHSGAGTQAALVQLVNGFADEWTDAIERAKHGDYRSLTDVSIDTLMVIDGAQTGGMIALENVAVLAAKLGSLAKSARAVMQSAYASVSLVPAEARNIATAMADGADAFVARLRAGGMQMATEGGGGGPGPNLGGLSAEALAEAAQAAKEAFKDKRLAQDAAKQTENHGTRPADDAPRSSDDHEHGTDAQPSSPVSDTARADEEFQKPLERKPFWTREGAQVEVVEQGRAIVPTGKVEVYPRGKVRPFTKEMADELKLLKNERQTARKEFDKDPSKAVRIKKLEDLKHNQQRSLEMAKSLDEGGLPDTLAVNEDIMRHLLEVGQKITERNRVQFRSDLTGSTGKVKLLTTWVILPDGRALLSTVMVIPR